MGYQPLVAKKCHVAKVWGPAQSGQGDWHADVVPCLSWVVLEE